jgi:hypothetical protein
MILNSTLYYWLMIPASILTAAILGYLLLLSMKWFTAYDSKKRTDYAASLTLILFVCSLVYFYTLPNTLIVIFADETVDEYVFLGKIGFEVGDNQYTLERDDYDDCFIVNQTGRLLVFEDFDYGAPPFTLPDFSWNKVKGLEPDSVKTQSSIPDYFPWQIPPDSIWVQNYIKWEGKEWVRYATDQEEWSFKNGEDPLKQYRHLFE